MILIGSFGARAEAQDSVTISYPVENPTWMAGSSQTVSATVSGNAPVSNMRVTIYATADPGNLLRSYTSAYTYFWYYNFICPFGSFTHGAYTNCTIQVDAIGSDGVTVVGTASTSVWIVTPWQRRPGERRSKRVIRSPAVIDVACGHGEPCRASTRLMQPVDVQDRPAFSGKTLAHDGLERNVPHDARRERVLERPVELGRARAVEGRGERGSLGSHRGSR